MIVVVKNGYIDGKYNASELNQHQKNKLLAQGYQFVEYSLNHKQPKYENGEWVEEYVIDKEALKAAASDAAKSFMNAQFDTEAIMKCMNAKNILMLIQRTAEQELIYQMILSVERWIDKVWEKYQEYKGLIISADTDSEIPEFIYTAAGSPPAAFGDINWFLSAKAREAEPDRPVNTDINFYINYQ